jgi:predicted Zn-dependent protease
MDQSSTFLEKRPAPTLLWQLRAVSAISLNSPTAGYEAGQQLLAMGAADSNDSNMQRLLAQLKNKGWLEKLKGGRGGDDPSRCVTRRISTT